MTKRKPKPKPKLVFTEKAKEYMSKKEDKEDKDKEKDRGSSGKSVFVPLVVLVILLVYLFVPAWIVAVGIGLPFPQVLFPTWGHNDLYGSNYSGYDSYKCTEMSVEVERWLESNGVHTYGVSGWENGNMTLEVNSSTGNIDYNVDGGNGHRWLCIDLGWFTDLTGITIPFDAQNMMIANPDWVMNYQVVTRDEGKYVGKQEIDYTEEDIEKIRMKIG